MRSYVLDSRHVLLVGFEHERRILSRSARGNIARQARHFCPSTFFCDILFLVFQIRGAVPAFNNKVADRRPVNEADMSDEAIPAPRARRQLAPQAKVLRRRPIFARLREG